MSRRRGTNLIIAAIFLLCLFRQYATAQQVTDTLNEVKIHGRHKEHISNDVRIKDFTPGQKKIIIDSNTLQEYQLQSVANLLAQQTSSFVKSYGFNGLATLNLRGSSAAQSQVLWNGIPIQNAALGVSDISTLPVMFMNKVSIVYGSSSALLGSGNVGGALLLENDISLFDTNGKRNLSVFAGAGSFGQYMGGLKAGISNKRWFIALSALGQTAQNNFSYTDYEGVEKQMTNSQLKSGALMLQAAYKLNETDVLDAYAWYQKYDRQIPPALFEQSSRKEQNDQSLKLLLDWKRHLEKNEWYVKNAFIHDDIQYKDPASNINTASPVSQYYFETGLTHTINRQHKLLLFVPVQASWTTYNGATKNQLRVAIAAAYNFKSVNEKWDVAVNAREEVIDGTSILSPGINASYVLTNWLSLRANVQRTYRAPNLNELYYFPGGNPNLEPEQGWNEDGGYRLQFKMGEHLFFKQDLSVFNRNIQDWIIWFGGSIWTPHNIAEVWSRGVETENLLRYQLDKWELHLGLNTSYVLATTVSSDVANDGSIDKQIPYTPRYNGQLNLGARYKRFYINYNQTYTGYRFITTDESEYIEPYTIGNVLLSYDFQLSKRKLSLNAQVNNIWNTHYQVVAYRPMPLANWLVGLRFSI